MKKTLSIIALLLSTQSFADQNRTETFNECTDLSKTAVSIMTMRQNKEPLSVAMNVLDSLKTDTSKERYIYFKVQNIIEKSYSTLVLENTENKNEEIEDFGERTFRDCAASYLK